MFYKWRTRRAKERFYRKTAGIMDTPPMPVVDAPLAIISMVSNSDPQMYILAMKSLYMRLKRGKMIAIIDRDMPEALRATLRHHLPGIQFSILEDIDTGPCQRGGTWERILYVLDHSEREYAIQMDADTLAFGPDLDEVVRCVENNVSFTLGNAGRPIEPMLDIVENARSMKNDYIGIVLEASFDKYPGAGNLKYVRASSGFCGYAKGGITRRAAEDFHAAGEALVGRERFREWGTEQSVSNFVVANTPGAVVLPYPKYANFWGGLPKGKSAFLHFIGANRYLDDHFATLAQGVIAELNSGRK